MTYKLTTATNVTNTGASVETKIFDDMYELQDYIETQTLMMSDDERELYHYNLNIEEL